MNRFEDVIRAATRRFAADPVLREEIARELRGHLEDSLQAARSEGLGEAQAEEAAVRAFGDPEEVGEKLLEANRRRMLWRMGWRAGSRVALLLALISAISPLAEWAGVRFRWKLNERVATALLILCSVALLYALSRWVLPKSAFIGKAYLRWLAGAFRRSVGLILRQPWIWAPVLAGVLLTVGREALIQRVAPQRAVAAESRQAVAGSGRVAAEAGKGAAARPPVFRVAKRVFRLPGGLLEFNGSDAAATIPGGLREARPIVPWGMMEVALALAFLLFFAQICRLLQTAGGMSPRQAKGWTAACVLGSCTMLAISAAGVWSRFHPQEHLPALFAWTFRVSPICILPFVVMEQGLFFALVIRALRGQPQSLRGLARTLSRCSAPLIFVHLIGLLLFMPLLVPLYQWVPRDLLQSSVVASLWLRELLTSNWIMSLMAFAAMVIVSDECGVGTGFLRFGECLRRYFWRFAALAVLGGALLMLPSWFLTTVFGPLQEGQPVAAPIACIVSAAYVFLSLVLTVMWFEFYRTKAGTAETVVAETADLERA